MYFVTVKRNGEELLRRAAFSDYAEAMGSLSRYYRPRAPRSVLEFATESINGRFARSYLTLMRPEDLDENEPFYEQRRHLAVKQRNAHEYDHSYFFLIESEVGIADAEDEDDDPDDP